MARLDEICVINMGQSPDSLTYNEEGNGLPFFQGNADFGEIYPAVRMWCSEPTKIAQEKDILISVRAPIGALNIANCECCIGRGLAGLTVNEDICVQDYLWYALSSKVDELNSKGTGSTFKAINKKILAETEIPLLPLAEQRKIAVILDKISGLIAKRRQQLNKLDELVKSRFIEMFGDPTYNPKGYKIKKLSQLGELNRGVSKARPRNSPELLGGPYPLVQTGEVTASELYINTYENTYSEKGLAQSRMWPKGTLCITIAANIAQTAILNIDACFPDSVVGFIPGKEVTQIYMHYWFTFFQKIIEEQAPQVAQKNINLKILNDLDMMVPERTLQEQFEKLVNQTDKSKLAIQKSLKKLETLKKALMQKYFD